MLTFTPSVALPVYKLTAGIGYATKIWVKNLFPRLRAFRWPGMKFLPNEAELCIGTDNMVFAFLNPVDAGFPTSPASDATKETARLDIPTQMHSNVYVVYIFSSMQGQF